MEDYVRMNISTKGIIISLSALMGMLPLSLLWLWQIGSMVDHGLRKEALSQRTATMHRLSRNSRFCITYGLIAEDDGIRNPQSPKHHKDSGQRGKHTGARPDPRENGKV